MLRFGRAVFRYTEITPRPKAQPLRRIPLRAPRDGGSEPAWYVTAARDRGVETPAGTAAARALPSTGEFTPYTAPVSQ